MLKLLYLLAGISLKQAVDEFKSMMTHHVERLERQFEDTKQYRPNAAVIHGTAEAHRAILEAIHEDRIQPELKRLSQRIRVMRAIPSIGYALLTIVLFIAIAWLESKQPTS